MSYLTNERRRKLEAAGEVLKKYFANIAAE